MQQEFMGSKEGGEPRRVRLVTFGSTDGLPILENGESDRIHSKGVKACKLLV